MQGEGCNGSARDRAAIQRIGEKFRAADGGDEGQHVAAGDLRILVPGRFRQGLANGAQHVLLDGPFAAEARPRIARGHGLRGGCVADVHRMDRAGHIHDRGAEQRGETIGIHRRGHRHQQQVIAQFPQLCHHRENKVGFQVALVHLIDDHRAHALQIWVAQQAAQQHAGGHKLNTCIG